MRSIVALSSAPSMPKYLEWDRQVLEEWMRSYEPELLFDSSGAPAADIRKLHPEGELRMSASPHTNGGLLLRIPAMDCPTEEGQIRRALEGFTDIRSLRFDLAAVQTTRLRSGARGGWAERLYRDRKSVV